MNEFMNTLNMVSLAVSGLMLVVGLVIWFFVNRASVRASEQVALLEALLEQQKRQNALLRRLCEAGKVEKEAPALASDDDEDLVRLVAER
ncbi:hypothetical protein GIX45_12785 [Erwinia sp. CPCC 100877]|nr:hypothetical protein [Erwinia sp. CPCC 100877]